MGSAIILELRILNISLPKSTSTVISYADKQLKLVQLMQIIQGADPMSLA